MYKDKIRIRKLWLLYDIIIYAFVVLILVFLHPSEDVAFSRNIAWLNIVVGFICLFGSRFVFDVYRQIWRYGILQAYLKLLFADFAGGVLFVIINRLIPNSGMTFIRILSIVCLNLLGCIAARMLYFYLYQYSSKPGKFSNLCKTIVRMAGGTTESEEADSLDRTERKINIAIIGAGKVGVSLAEELLINPGAVYYPVCFVDTDENKIGRIIHNIPIFDEAQLNSELLNSMNVQEVVFALPQISQETRKKLYEKYSAAGCKVKVYDFPTVNSLDNRKRTLREFDIEELLFRRPLEIEDKETRDYYFGKTILITGGGGSIGSELARQIAKMNPRKLVILDVYENGAYDLQQELKLIYGSKLDLQIEICNICNINDLDYIFEIYKPDIVLHAAAHKHVPLMEHNIVEAINNNVFGTLNVVDMVEKHNIDRFIMISTDKAVNPTNVMGATKRLCEMIILSKAKYGNSNTIFSATRFGNVLGSAGSVIPLFKKQIAVGGPVTITDKRIIRYFMTIPEASQLVLKSGAMAKNGELFILDMGKPVKILDLAENMIKLSGLTPDRDIEIVETGLRPGEKLYEELLVKGEKTRQTEDNKIYIEEDEPVSGQLIGEKLDALRKAISENNYHNIKKALKEAVPTFCEPDEINKGNINE